MLLDVLLALGLLASTASQLRPSGASIGPGEAGLALWCAAMLTREVLRLGPPMTFVFSRLLAFWIIFGLALCLGTMTEYAIGSIHDPEWFLHDIIAYAVVCAISCLVVVEPGAEARMRRVAWLLATLGAAWLGLQAAIAWDLVSIEGADPWEWDRFRGLSENANQLALLCSVIALLSLHLLTDAASRPRGRIAALISMVAAIVVGRLTKSDAFLIVLLAAGPIFLALRIRTWLQSSQRVMTLRFAFAGLLVLVLPLALAYLVPVSAALTSDTGQAVMQMSRGGSTGETEETTRLRFEIWSAALRRGLEAKMLGLGPGPHLEIPPSLAAGRQSTVNDPLKHPHVGLVPNFEAHNTILDLFIQGGLMAVSVFVWLGATALSRTYRAKLDGLTTLLVGIAMFSVFHLIVRHPIIWFSIAFCLVMATPGCQALPVRPNASSNARSRALRVSQATSRG